MNATLFFDHRFRRAPDGTLYSPKSYSADLFTRRYLGVFDTLNVISRIEDVENTADPISPSESDRITIQSIGDWRGLTAFLRNRSSIRKLIYGIPRDHSVIVIAPGMLAHEVSDCFARSGRPFAAEVVGDPYDVFSTGATSHPLRRWLQWTSARSLRHVCQNTCAVSYVTANALQQRYPSRNDAFSTHYSSIELSDEAFLERKPVPPTPSRAVRLVTVGTLEQAYKGVDNLIRSVRILKQEHGLDASLTIVGGGRLQQEYEQLARDTGCADQITFTGNVPAGDAVRKILDTCDIFVLASRQEGLPRAMIEAMARGLTCVGTRVGGIPELLDEDLMASPNDPEGLATVIHRVAADTSGEDDRMRSNRDKAMDYRADTLQARRRQLYEKLVAETRHWIAQNSGRTET